MKIIFVFLLLMVSAGCFSSSASQDDSTPRTRDYGSGGLIGTHQEMDKEDLDKKKKTDEMLLMQQKQVERQRKELEDVKRQQYYDQKYNQYLSEHK